MCLPMPVFILAAYDESGQPNAMNAAWGGVSNDFEVSVCISPDHKTTANILTSKAFTISMGTASQLAACDYVGIVSGNDNPGKISRAGWTAVRSEHVNAPIFKELPLAMECRLISYTPETCRLVGEIVNVSADESILNDKGKVDISMLRPICYDPFSHAYHEIGEKAGDAFKAGNSLR